MFAIAPHCSSRLLVFLFAVVLAMVISLTGCRKSSQQRPLSHTRNPEAEDIVTIATSPSPFKSTPAPAETISLSATPTAANIFLSTSTATAAATTATPDSCTFQYFFYPSPAACPGGAPIDSAAAEQQFEHGFMLWLEANNSVFVFAKDGRFQRYEDTFVEGQPENDPSFVPPENLYQPVRGFGKVWRENLEVREKLGWATGRELGFKSLLQLQEKREDGLTILFVRAFNGQILGLTYRDSDAGDWIIAAS